MTRPPQEAGITKGPWLDIPAQGLRIGLEKLGANKKILCFRFQGPVTRLPYEAALIADRDSYKLICLDDDLIVSDNLGKGLPVSIGAAHFPKGYYTREQKSDQHAFNVALSPNNLWITAQNDDPLSHPQYVFLNHYGSWARDYLDQAKVGIPPDNSPVWGRKLGERYMLDNNAVNFERLYSFGVALSAGEMKEVVLTELHNMRPAAFVKEEDKYLPVWGKAASRTSCVFEFAQPKDRKGAILRAFWTERGWQIQAVNISAELSSLTPHDRSVVLTNTEWTAIAEKSKTETSPTRLPAVTIFVLNPNLIRSVYAKPAKSSPRSAPKTQPAEKPIQPPADASTNEEKFSRLFLNEDWTTRTFSLSPSLQTIQHHRPIQWTGDMIIRIDDQDYQISQLTSEEDSIKLAITRQGNRQEIEFKAVTTIFSETKYFAFLGPSNFGLPVGPDMPDILAAIEIRGKNLVIHSVNRKSDGKQMPHGPVITVKMG